MSDFNEFLNEQLEDPEFKKEYDALNLEFSIISAFLAARRKVKMTQKEVADKSGVAQADISKFECGRSNPTVKMLDRLANAMDMHIEVRFVPNN